MNIDYSSLIITIATDFRKSRWPFLYATLAGIVSQVKNTRIYLLGDNEKNYEDFKPYLETLRAIARVNNNGIAVRHSNASVGKRKADLLVDFLGHPQDIAWMNVDDDYVIPGNTLLRIKNALHHTRYNNPLCYAAWDVINTRKYPDWQENRVSHLEVSPRDSIFCLTEDSETEWLVPVPNISAGAFVIPTKLLTRFHLEEMGSLAKGIRGYDIQFGRHLEGWKLILGADAYHVGILEPFLDGKKWHNVSPLIEQRAIKNAK